MTQNEDRDPDEGWKMLSEVSSCNLQETASDIDLFSVNPWVKDKNNEKN